MSLLCVFVIQVHTIDSSQNHQLDHIGEYQEVTYQVVLCQYDFFSQGIFVTRNQVEHGALMKKQKGKATDSWDRYCCNVSRLPTY